ncbi:MAG: MFS transporter [Acidimicrobiia bacterium]
MATRLGSAFDRLTLASGISNVGDGAFGAAFPLLVATLTRDPILVAGATFVGRLPWFLFALVSGALVDRMDRKKVMVVTDSLRALGVGLIAWGVATDHVGLPAVYVLAFALGVAETFFDTSAEALTPALVDEGQLPAANGRLQGLEWVGGSFLGPPAGAALFALAASLPFFADSASFALAAVLVALIPGSFRTLRETQTTIGEDIRAGIGWLWRQRVVRTLALLAGITNMFTFGIIAVFVLYAQDILGVSDSGFGVLLAALGVGGLAGALLAPRIVSALGSGNTLRASLLAQIAGTAAFGFVSSPWAAGALLVVFGMLITTWNVVAVSLRQSLTPDAIRGRVAGASRLLAWGSQPVGALMGGLVANAFGLRAPFFVAAGAFVVSTSVAWQIISNRSIEEARSGKEPSATQ